MNQRAKAVCGGALCGAFESGIALMTLTWFEGREGFWLGTTRDWMIEALIVGLLLGGILGALVGVAVALTKARALVGALVGAGVGLAIASFLLLTTASFDESIRIFGAIAIMGGALTGLVAGALNSRG